MTPRETLIEAGDEALMDALDRSVCLGDTRLHQAVPIWGDRADPPEDYDRWISFAAARVLNAVLAHPVEVIAALCECETCGGTGQRRRCAVSILPSSCAFPDGHLGAHLTRREAEGYDTEPVCPSCDGSGVDGVRREAALRALELEQVGWIYRNACYSTQTMEAYSGPIATDGTERPVFAFPAPVGDDAGNPQ